MSDDNVHVLDGYTRLPIPVERVLSEAIKNVDHEEIVIVLGVDKEGEYYFASSNGDGPTTVWMLEKAKEFMLRSAG